MPALLPLYAIVFFYKQLALGVAGLGASLIIGGAFIYIPFQYGEVDFLKNIVCGGGSALTSASLGLYHLKLAFNNKEAQDQYIRQLSIKLLAQALRPSGVQNV